MRVPLNTMKVDRKLCGMTFKAGSDDGRVFEVLG